MHASAIPAVAGAVICLAASANAQVFSAVNLYSSDNPAAQSNWMSAALVAGATGFGFETFDEYAGQANVNIAPGTTLTTSNGVGLFFDQSADASSASRLLIDTDSASWTGTPPFEGSPALEGFMIVPGGTGSGTNYADIIFPEAVIGFAMDLESATSGGDLTFTVNGETLSVEAGLPGGADGFYAFVADQSFTSIRLGAENTGFAGEVFDLDNLQWAVAVPAPGSAALLSVGAFAATRRRRR